MFTQVSPQPATIAFLEQAFVSQSCQSSLADQCITAKMTLQDNGQRNEANNAQSINHFVRWRLQLPSTHKLRAIAPAVSCKACSLRKNEMNKHTLMCNVLYGQLPSNMPSCHQAVFHPSDPFAQQLQDTTPLDNILLALKASPLFTCTSRNSIKISRPF